MEPYTQKEAEAAAGMGSYVPPKKRVMRTQGTGDGEDEMMKEEPANNT